MQTGFLLTGHLNLSNGIVDLVDYPFTNLRNGWQDRYWSIILCICAIILFIQRKYFFHCEGKRPVSMVLFMIQAKEVAIIGPASFRSRNEMLSRPVALFYLVTLKLQWQRYVVN